MISVIIPAYNVEKYIDRCLISVVNQTFRDIEIIIINDGSTDTTLDKCLEWQAYDSRIRVISQENQGQGIARNIGIAQSGGEYLAFVDADDWLDVTAFEKAYKRICEANADIALFHLVCVHIDEDGRVTGYEKLNNQVNQKDCWDFLQDYSFVYKISGVLWDALWKRELFKDIKMPGHAYEDELTVLKIFLSGVKLVQVQEHLYYYNLYRTDNTTHSEKSANGLEQAFLVLKNFFRNRTDYEKIYYMLRIRVLACYRNLLWNYFDQNPCGIKRFEERAISYLKREFPEKKISIDRKCLLIGSYNLRLIVKRAFEIGNEQIDDYAMSSLISAMQKKESTAWEICNASPYEKNMIQKDCAGDFCALLETIQENQYEFVIIDFLEELRGIMKCHELYFTVTEKVVGIQNKIDSEITFDSEEFINIWKEAADMLIKRLKELFRQEQVILICNYQNQMILHMGDLRYAQDTDDTRYKILMTLEYEPYIMRKKISETLYSCKDTLVSGFHEHQPKILMDNERLKEMYGYFIQNYPGIRVVSVPEEYMGTDEFFPIGARPEYFNEAYYQQAADALKMIELDNRLLAH